MKKHSNSKTETEKLRQQLENKQLIFETINILRQSRNTEHMFKTLSSVIHEIIKNAIITVFRVDESTNCMDFMDVEGLPIPQEQMFQVLGFDKTNLNLKIEKLSQKEINLYRSGRMEYVENGIFGLISMVSTKEACDTLEKMLSIKTVYIIGVLCENILVGGFYIFAQENIDQHRELIEEIINQSRFIIQRQRAETMLIESEEKYRTLFETMVQGVVYQNADGTIISANPAAERILGISIDQMKGLTSMDPRWKAIKEDGSDFPGDQHPIPVALRTGKEVLGVVHGVFHPKKNDYVWIKVNAVPLFKPGKKKPYKAYATIEDITEKRVSEENYHMLFNEMLDGFALHEIICNDQGEPVDYRFLTINPSFERMTGLSAQNIVGKTVLEVMPGIEAHWIKTYGDVALTGKPVFFQNYSAELNMYFEVTAFRPMEKQFACIFTDITSRKKAEEELKHAYEKLDAFWNIATIENTDNKTICDNILESIVKMTKSDFGFYGFMNHDESMMTIHSWSGEAMKGCSVFDKPREFSIDTAGIWGEAIRQRKPFILNDYAQHHPAKKGLPEGHVSLTNLLVVPVFSHGRIVSVAAVANRAGDYSEADAKHISAFTEAVQAIIDRKFTEEALKASEASHRALIEGLPDIIMRFDAEGRHLFVSENVTEVVNFTASQFIGKTHQELGFPVDMCILWEASIRSVFTTGNALEKEFSFEGKKGRSTVNWRLLPEYDKNKKISSVLSISRDITEQKKNEGLFKQNQLYLKKAQELGKIGHFSIDPESMTGEGSEELLHILDIDSEDQLSKAFFDMIYPDDTHRVLPFIDRALQEGTSFDLEYRICPQNGKIRYVNTRGEMMNTIQGRRMVGIVQDITERKRTEEALVNTQKLESLGILAGGLAHDFNNLLGGIYGFVEIANEETTEQKTSQYLTKALNTIDRARGLTTQLLTFSKGGAPIRNLEPLDPFIKETAKFALSGSNVSVRFAIPADLWNCSFDKNQIGQVIDNLVINAQQAMPLGGSIEISAENIVLEEKEHPVLKKGNYVRISVKDSGIGISSELLPRVFDPFFTTKLKGHGLGLASCYSIISQHGGYIDVESQQNTGSTFYVFLPAAEDAAAMTQKKPDAVHKGTGLFMIMDDEQVMLETIGHMLESFGYTVVTKTNGQEALLSVQEALQSNQKIAGLIFDLTIPGSLGGKETVKEIRKLDPDIPVFVMSGYAEDAVMANPQKYEFTASICKPFMKTDIAKMLNQYITNNNAV